MKIIKNSSVVFFVLLVIALFNIYSVRYIKGNDSAITIDCSVVSQTLPHSMVGFLHSVNFETRPSKVITDLNPKFWRFNKFNGNAVNWINSIGARPIFVLSDAMKYPRDGDSWTAPNHNPQIWQQTIRNVLIQHKAEGRIAIYDIWNEPDGKHFFRGPQDDFFETFKIGYDQIRAMPNGNDLKITGPSISQFDTTYIRKFLDFCLSNHIRLDVLSWHDFQSGNGIFRLEDNIKFAKSQFVDNPRYAPLQIKGIVISEFVNPINQYSPASILACLYYLEKGGADGGCKGCWVGSDGQSNCSNNSLDGILDPKTQQPRSAWWAYRYYNLSLNNRLKAISTNVKLVCFANYQTNEIQLVVGYYGNPANTVANTNAIINLNNISSLSAFSLKKTVNVKILSIPDSGENVFTTPQIISNTTAQIINGKITIPLQNISLQGLNIVEIN